MDIGFEALESGEFLSSATSKEGKLDIFAFDLVIRCEERHLNKSGANRIRVLSIGPIQVDAAPQAAVSVGPALATADFVAHPINGDPSLGSKPPFTDRRMARMVLYHTVGGLTHLRLFDGRPGSDIFAGVTPAEACFLDPGQTAKLCVSDADSIASYGNRHYLKWPPLDDDEGEYIWVPEQGRPISSMITLR